MSPAAARERERVRVATALAELPLIDEAFGSGEISYSKARAVMRVASLENDEVLLTSARGMSAAELEKLCQMVRSVGSGSEAVEHERGFSQRAIGDGMTRMTVTVTAACADAEFRFRTRDGEILPEVPDRPAAPPLPPESGDPLRVVPTDDLRPIDWSLVVDAIIG